MAPSSAPGPRTLAATFLVATIAALVVDAALQLALDAVRVSGYGGGAPWWLTANLIQRGRWVALALLLWAVAPWLAGRRAASFGSAADHEAPGDAWRLGGLAVIAVPLLWVLATWMVSAVRFTLLGSWSTEGRAFVSPDYYRAIVLDYAPWLMAGVAVLAVRRHLR